MSILNLFFLILKNTQRPKPAPCLALCPFSLILAYPKYSQNKQIKNLKSTSPQPTKTAKPPPLGNAEEIFFMYKRAINCSTMNLWTFNCVTPTTNKSD